MVKAVHGWPRVNAVFSTGVWGFKIQSDKPNNTNLIRGKGANSADMALDATKTKPAPMPMAQKQFLSKPKENPIQEKHWEIPVKTTKLMTVRASNIDTYNKYSILTNVNMNTNSTAKKKHISKNHKNIKNKKNCLK